MTNVFSIRAARIANLNRDGIDDLSDAMRSRLERELYEVLMLGLARGDGVAQLLIDGMQDLRAMPALVVSSSRR